MKLLYMMIVAIALTACGPSKPDAQTPNDTLVKTSSATEQSAKNNPDTNSYATYCFERIGQVGGEPRRGDKCSVHGSGTGGGHNVYPDQPPRNQVVVHISAPSMATADMDSVSFILYRGDKTPKFPMGVQVVDQVSLGDLPNREVTGSHTVGLSYYLLTKPDADNLREKLAPHLLNGYEIVSAVLTIDKAVDRPMRDEDLELAKAANQIHGLQYIEGTFTLSLIPLAPQGEEYGPKTFEFGTTIDWADVR